MPSGSGTCQGWGCSRLGKYSKQWAAASNVPCAMACTHHSEQRATASSVPRATTRTHHSKQRATVCNGSRCAQHQQGPAGARPPTSPSPRQGGSNVCPLPSHDFNLFSQETWVSASRRVGAGSRGRHRAQAHKAPACGVARGKGHQRPSAWLQVSLHVGFLAPALGHPWGRNDLLGSASG